MGILTPIENIKEKQNILSDRFKIILKSKQNTEILQDSIYAYKNAPKLFFEESLFISNLREAFFKNGEIQFKSFNWNDLTMENFVKAFSLSPSQVFYISEKIRTINNVAEIPSTSEPLDIKTDFIGPFTNDTSVFDFIEDRVQFFTGYNSNEKSNNLIVSKSQTVSDFESILDVKSILFKETLIFNTEIQSLIMFLKIFMDFFHLI